VLLVRVEPFTLLWLLLYFFFRFLIPDGPPIRLTLSDDVGRLLPLLLGALLLSLLFLYLPLPGRLSLLAFAVFLLFLLFA